MQDTDALLNLHLLMCMRGLWCMRGLCSVEVTKGHPKNADAAPPTKRQHGGPSGWCANCGVGR